MDINISSQIVVQTAAQWAADATVYSNKRILITSDAFFSGTDQRRFKIADGTQTWAQLDYFPDPITFASVITGFVTGANLTVLNTDTLEVAIEKLQGQIDALKANTIGT